MQSALHLLRWRSAEALLQRSRRLPDHHLQAAAAWHTITIRGSSSKLWHEQVQMHQQAVIESRRRRDPGDGRCTVWGPCLQVDAVVSEGSKHAEARHDGPDGLHAVYDAHARMLCAVPHQLLLPLCRQCTLNHVSQS